MKVLKKKSSPSTNIKNTKNIKKNITTRCIVERHGGSLATAVVCGVSQFAVVQWISRNYIPHPYWKFFIESKCATLEELDAACSESDVYLKKRRKLLAGSKK